MPKIQLRQDISGNWRSRNPILLIGEFGIETDTNKFKIGDGETSWNSLDYITPTKTSDLTNDSGYINISAVPTLTSQLTNDSGFLTAHQDLSDKQDKLTAGRNITIDENNVISSADVSATTNYEELINKPQINGITLSGNKTSADLGIITSSDIPTKTSDLTNDSGFINISFVPTQTSQLNNDSGYLTTTDLNNYAAKTYVNNGLATKQDLLTADNGGTDIAISTGGVGDDVTVSGNGSILLEKAEADSLNSVTLTGGCEQTATPSPSTPVDITTNNGNITVSPNLFRTLGTTTTQGGVTFTPQADGSVVCSGRATAYYSYYLGRADFDPSTIDKITVAINGTFNASGNIVVDKFHVYSGSTSLGTISYTTWTQSLTVDIANDYPTADNIRVYIKRNSNTDTNATIKPMAVKGTTNKAWKPYGQITITGTVETVTDEDGNTATAENLLAVGNYADTQELITGAVNRQLAILVLTGTESWSGNSSNSYFSLAKSAISPTPIATSYAPLCTHLVSANTYESVAGTIYFGTSYLNVNYNNEGGGSSSSARANFNNWLKTQFANGTPVIVVYPLATETTETVTGQTLTTIDGDNTLTISQASINNLPISANYTQKAGMTINFTNDTGYITSSALSGYVQSSDLATVATSGDYDDLTNKPTIPTVGNGTITITQGGTTKGTFTVNQSGDTTIALDAGGGGGTVDQTFDGTSTNAQSGVAIAGELADYVTTTQLDSYEFISADTLDGYVTTSDLQSDYYTSSTIDTMFGDYTSTQSLATVALTGDYDDLQNKPSGVTVDQTYDGTSTNAQSGVAIAGELADYQESLVSGTNIKTVGGKSLLGSGNISQIDNMILKYPTIRTESTYCIFDRKIQGTMYALQINKAMETERTDILIDGITVYDASTQLIPDARISSNIARTSDIPTATSDLTNDSGYITGITSTDITTALGYTPVNKAGDTMTGGLILSTDDTDNSSININNVSSTQRDITFNAATHRTAVIRSVVNSSNQCQLLLGVNNTNNDAPNGIRIVRDTSGTAYIDQFPQCNAIDGQWVATIKTVISTTTSIPAGTSLSYKLNTYLPNDNYKYEVMYTAVGETAATSGAVANIGVGSDFISTDNNGIVVQRTRTTSSMNWCASGTMIINNDSNRYIYIKQRDANSTCSMSHFRILAYRRLGTNL